MGSVLTVWFLLVYWRRRRGQWLDAGLIDHSSELRSASYDASLEPAEADKLSPVDETLPEHDLSRNVYCVLGVPIDAVDMKGALRRVEIASHGTEPFLLSTANLNFLVNAQRDPEFRESLLVSDLCVPDGIGMVLAARLLGLPIRERVSGSDIFASLKTDRRATHPLRVFLFGGNEGVAGTVQDKLNAQKLGLNCVGSINPGYGTAEEMSKESFINAINTSNAQFLIASLGAKKGQSWLLRNHARLSVPVRAHLGATICFEAGTVRRAPQWMRNCGLEWLWRIKEEPYLWTRYAHDGLFLLYLLLTRALPLALGGLLQELRWSGGDDALDIAQTQDQGSITIGLSGVASARNVEEARLCFQRALRSGKQVIIDCSGLRFLDARFLGLLIILRKQLLHAGLGPSLVGVSPKIARILRLNGLEGFLSAPSARHCRMDGYRLRRQLLVKQRPSSTLGLTLPVVPRSARFLVLG